MSLSNWMPLFWRRDIRVSEQAPEKGDSSPANGAGARDKSAPETTHVPDRGGELLQAFLSSDSETAADAALNQLFQDYIQPLTENVVRSRMRYGHGGVSEGDLPQEAISEARATLLVRLRRLRERRHEVETPSIQDLSAYVATSARHACDDLIRYRDPGRLIRENRLRYLLRHTPGLAVWKENGQTICGFDAWRQNPNKSGNVTATAGKMEALLKDRCPHLAANTLGEADFCAALFDSVGSPVSFQSLLQVFVAYRPANLSLAVEERPSRGPAGGKLAEFIWDDVADTRADVQSTVFHRDHLRRLWEEVQLLPPRQCTALLMNLRDGEGHGVLALFPILGIASQEEIATVLQMTPAEFEAYWDRLPLDDNEIGSLLEATRQQVINLRKVARERLSRRFTG